MYRAEFQVAEDILGAWAEGARAAPGLMKTASRRNLSRFKSRVLLRLRDEPPKLTRANYPLRWKSARQRRYVMMKLRQENNLPYQRTHTLSEAWDVVLELTSEGGTFYAVNDTPYVQYVVGDYQQPFHIDNGWQPAAQQIVAAEEELSELLIETWYTVVDGFVG